jgi:hypothetical protein
MLVWKLYLPDFLKYTVKIVFLWYTETVFSWYIQSLVLKCAYFISLSNGNTFRSLTIPKRKWYLWGSKSVFVIILTLVDNKSWKKNFLSSYIALSNWIWKIYHIDIILRPKLCQFVQFEISPSMSHKVFILLKITPIYPCIYNKKMLTST